MKKAQPLAAAQPQALATEPSILRAFSRTLNSVVAALDLPPRQGIGSRWVWQDSTPPHEHERLANLIAAFEQARRATGLSCLGLRFGLHVRPGTFGALGYAAMNADTVGACLAAMKRFGQTVIQLGCTAMSTEMSDGELVIEWNPTRLPLADHDQLTEAMLCSIFQFGRWITGNPEPLGRVEFRHPAPTDTRLHQALFSHAVVFGAARSRIVLPLWRLATPLLQADSHLHQLMARHLLARLEQGSVLRQLRPVLQSQLPTGAISLAVAARRMGTSTRSLQRNLQAQGLSFRQFLDQLRHELATQYLANPALSVAEISGLLGFAKPSSFSRRYRHWTGQPPSVRKTPKTPKTPNTPQIGINGQGAGIT